MSAGVMEPVYDVIVVGAGGAGLAAGVSAAEEGLKVLLLEKKSQPGGTTAMAVGSLTANRTAWQRSKGLRDKWEWHQEDAARFAPKEIESRNNSKLRGFFLQNSAETLDWLQSLGVEFVGPSPEPPNRIPRMHNVVPNGRAYVYALLRRFYNLGGKLVCRAQVKGLNRKCNRSLGVVVHLDEGCTQMEVGARIGVVLATGDYANSKEWISRYKGERFSRIEGINPDATGDGHQLVESLGGKLLNMEITYGPELRFVPPKPDPMQNWLAKPGMATWVGRIAKRLPNRCLQPFIRRLLVTWQHPENGLFLKGAILVNRNGRRFCDEKVSPEREIALSEQPGKEGFILLDERLHVEFNAWPNFISTAPQIAYAYVADYLKLRPDIAVVASSLQGLCKRKGLPLEALSATVEAWNTTAENPLSGTRWVMLGPVKPWFTTTEGGAAINEDFQVLDHKGHPIAGLYAVGQVGLGGQILWGHGLHIGWAITSGRLVGRILAKSIRRPMPDYQT